MRRALLRRILLSYVIIASLLLFVFWYYLSGVIENNHISQLRENLTVHGRLIAEAIPLSFTGDLDSFCKRYKEKTGARITVIDSSGSVLGDSDEPSYRMGNHLNRPEIIESKAKGIGSAIRFTETTQEDFFHLAIATTRDSQKRFLRLSVPLKDVETAVGKIRSQVLLAYIASLLIVIVVGILQTGRIMSSIEEITTVLKEIASGRFRKRLFPKEKDELGKLANDVSDMAQALQEKLKQSEEEKYMTEAILSNMSDGLMLTDTKGRILLSNYALKNFFGIESDMEGRTLMETLRNVEVMELVDKVIDTGEPISREIEVTHPKEMYLMATATPFTVKEKPSGVVLAFHDVTRLRQLEDMRRDFIANVSHEIKTPITAIKGFAETLLEGGIDDRENAKKFLETIKNHSERLNSLVSDLLTLSRIELGDIKIEKTPVNLDNVVDTVFATLGEKAQGKGLYLKKQIPPTIKEIKADRDRLIQILLNLVDNSIKFTEKGGVTVTVESKNDGIDISIEDTGIGISKKHLPRIGERFYRVDRARSRELGGTGLGLAIVKHFVKAHGWEMEIESTEGKGTKVRLIYPIT